MITELKIENYKSIQDLTLDVGRVNVLIGENGCGKSNILEAITLAAAAKADKLANEFLGTRIRVTEPELMRSVFKEEYCNKDIKIKIKMLDFTFMYSIFNENKPYSKWEKKENIYNQDNELIENATDEWLRLLGNIYEDNDFNTFLIYSPENTSLRNLNKEGQIQPLGINGEGLLKLLIVTQHEAKNFEQLNQELERFNDIQETLELFGWFDSMQIPDDFSLLEKKITIKDRYLEMPFDQRSANEGFLLVLFYITLVVSKYTPKIFAIDNIDTSLNPKLCSKLIEELARLAKKYDKQIFLTSHNPAILDGIDLNDDEQRLFVVSRNKQGHTRCKRIQLKDKPKSSVRESLSRVFNEENKLYTQTEILNRFDDSEEPVKLSEGFLRGYLGGLPKGF